MSEINRYNHDILVQTLFDLDRAAYYFTNSTYSTFKSSYLNSCGDSYVNRMSSKLDRLYQKIDNAYNKIKGWYGCYYNDLDFLEQSLINGQGKCYESPINASVNALPSLDNIKNQNNKIFNSIITSTINKRLANIKSKPSSSKPTSPITSLLNEASKLFGNFKEQASATATTTTANLKSLLSELDTLTTSLKNKMNCEVTKTATSIVKELDNTKDKVISWWNNEAMPSLKNGATTVCNYSKELIKAKEEADKKIKATLANVGASITEGVGLFGEHLMDFFATVVTNAAIEDVNSQNAYLESIGIEPAINSKEFEQEITKQTSAFVGKTFVKDFYDVNVYETKIKDTNGNLVAGNGNWISNNSLWFDQVRGIGNGLGEMAGTVATGALTGGSTLGLAVIAGVSGFGQGTENAINNGGTFYEANLAGSATGLLNGIQYYIGAQINNVKVINTEGLKSQLLNSAVHVTLDSIDSALESFVNPAINQIYAKGYYDQDGNYIEYLNDETFFERYTNSFNENGGWAGVATNALVGAIGSSLGETFDIARFFKNKNESINVDKSFSQVLFEKKLKNEIPSERIIDPTHGYQLNISDYNDFYKVRLENGYFTREQLDNMLKNINSYGYLDEQTGNYLKNLVDNQDYDIYFKSIHDTDLDSIMEKGIYCNGTVTSLGGGLPTSINDIDLGNTVTEISGMYDLITRLKKANGLSQGNNPINGALILKVPKGTSLEDMIKSGDGYFAIKPELIDSFIGVKPNGIVEKIQTSNQVRNKYFFALDNSQNELKNTVQNSSFIGSPYRNTIDINSFLEQNIDEQISIINSNGFYKIKKLFETEGLDPKVKEALNNKILTNQDILMLENSMTPAMQKYLYKYISQSGINLSELTDDNLIRLISNASNNEEIKPIIQEIKRRFEAGNNFFSGKSITANVFGSEKVDYYSAINILYKNDQELLLSIRDKAKSIISSHLPKDLNDLNFKDWPQRFSLALMFKKEKIDEQTLKKMYENIKLNNNWINEFNMQLLDHDVIQELGIDFVFDIGKHQDLGFEILSLRNSNKRLYDAFLTCKNEIDYDNSLNISSKETLAILDFLFNNQEALKDFDFNNMKKTSFIEFCLRNQDKFSRSSTEIPIDLSPNYLEDYFQSLDTKFKASYQSAKKYQSIFGLNELKENYLSKYFSLTSDDANYLLNKYFSHIEEVSLSANTENQAYISFLKTLDKVVNSNDADFIKECYDNQSFRLTAEEILNLDDKLRLLYADTYTESLSLTSKIIQDKLIGDFQNITYDNYNAKMIDLTNEDFNFLVHSNSTGFVKNKESLLNDSFVDDWNQLVASKTHGLSTSYISSKNLGSCQVLENGVLYGFDNIKANDIYLMGPYDINSNIANYGFSANRKQIFISANEMSKNTTRVYNEFVLDRTKVKPDCVIIYDSSSQEQINDAIKAASQWGIPIVKIDKEKLISNQINSANKDFQKFLATADLSSLETSLDSIEEAASGLKLNAITSSKDPTATIDNSNLAKYFNKEEIENLLTEKIQTITDQATLDKIKMIFNNINERYKIANDYGTNGIAKTKSYIDYDKLLQNLK